MKTVVVLVSDDMTRSDITTMYLLIDVVVVNSCIYHYLFWCRALEMAYRYLMKKNSRLYTHEYITEVLLRSTAAAPPTSMTNEGMTWLIVNGELCRTPETRPLSHESQRLYMAHKMGVQNGGALRTAFSNIQVMDGIGGGSVGSVANGVGPGAVLRSTNPVTIECGTLGTLRPDAFVQFVQALSSMSISFRNNAFVDIGAGAGAAMLKIVYGCMVFNVPLPRSLYGVEQNFDEHRKFLIAKGHIQKVSLLSSLSS
jgi:hypothetical protein